MRGPAKTRSFVIVLLELLLCAGFADQLRAQTNDIAVVVNSNNPVTNLSLNDLRKLLSGDKRVWPGGAVVKLIVRPPGGRERAVMLHLLGISEGDYKQYWTAKIFRGDADAEPIVVPSFGMTREAIKLFPGAIALASAQEVKTGMDVKVLTVDKHMPGEDGYPLK
jgi:hypothetical protein